MVSNVIELRNAGPPKPTTSDASREKPAPNLSKCVPLRWPAAVKDRHALFQDWHCIAMQVLHAHRTSFRLMAVTYLFINWKTGEMWPTNELLAARAGGCHPSTMKREVAAYRNLGLIQVKLGWRANTVGKPVRKRTIRLAIPYAFRDQITDFDRSSY